MIAPPAFPVPIVCTAEGLPSWAAGAYTDDGQIILRPWACTALRRARAGRVQINVGGAALWILSHEYAHATLGAIVDDRNVTDQGEDPTPADCAGWKLMPKVAQLLSLRPAIRDRLIGANAPAALRECP